MFLTSPIGRDCVHTLAPFFIHVSTQRRVQGEDTGRRWLTLAMAFPAVPRF